MQTVGESDSKQFELCCDKRNCKVNINESSASFGCDYINIFI